MNRLAARAEALCRAVAPDVARGPFYVVLRPDLPPEYQGGDGGALALTSRHLDLMLRTTLGQQRRWARADDPGRSRDHRGRGRAPRAAGAATGVPGRGDGSRAS